MTHSPANSPKEVFSVCPPLVAQETNTHTFLYSNMSKNKTCTVMLLFNLAKPDWISITCDNKILNHIFCYLYQGNVANHNSSSINIQNTKDHTICSKFHMLYKQICVNFYWVDNTNNSRNACIKHIQMNTYKELKGKPVNMTIITFLEQIFDATFLKYDYPSVLIDNGGNTMKMVKFQRFWNKLNFKKKTVPNYEAKWFYLCQYNRPYIPIGIILFCCKAGRYILMKSICDEIIDCPNDKSDEESCHKHSSNYSISSLGKYMNPKGTCYKYKNTKYLIHSMTSKSITHFDNIATKNNNKTGTTEIFICNDNKTKIDKLDKSLPVHPKLTHQREVPVKQANSFR